jgi:hypothetical protein
VKTKHWIILFISLFIIGYAGIRIFRMRHVNHIFTIGQAIDSINGVYVYFNGNISHDSGRNLTPDGYNLGKKYQCVEFVKRYYYIRFNHKMPDSYGHAKDFFDPGVRDGQINKTRNLTQYVNPSRSKPMVNDLLVFGGTIYNRYGHVAIISKVSESEIEIIQQNPGPTAPSRTTFPLIRQGGRWNIKNGRILGWLRKE